VKRLTRKRTVQEASQPSLAFYNSSSQAGKNDRERGACDTRRGSAMKRAHSKERPGVSHAPRLPLSRERVRRIMYAALAIGRVHALSRPSPSLGGRGQGEGGRRSWHAALDPAGFSPSPGSSELEPTSPPRGVEV